MPPLLLTSARDAVALLGPALVLALLALTWSTWLVLRQRRELEDLRSELRQARSGSRARTAAGWAVRQVLGTATRVRERGFFEGVLMAPIEDLARMAGEESEAIESVLGEDGTVTVMFSDIEGSTELNEELGDDAFVRLLAEHDRLVRHEVERRGGRVVKSQGDGFMAVFGTPSDAVAAAAGIQRRAATGRRARRVPVRVRIGINCGRVVSRDGDYFGRNVAKAARIAALAEGGQTLLSEQVIEGLGDATSVEHHGRAELRGLSGAHDLYAVTG